MAPPFLLKDGWMILRHATPIDAPWAAPLIQATIGGIGWALTGEDGDPGAVSVLSALFPRPGHRLSFEQALVAEEDGTPLGLAVSYPGDGAEGLDDPYRARLRDLGQPSIIQTEAQPDEWYLDTLATRPEARGRGVGSALVEAVAKRAREAGHARLGLLVEPANDGARRLYARLGFMEAGRRTVAGHAFLHLVRPL